MAESLVQVTEGVGKKLHTFNRTIGANSVEDEIVLQGEQYLPTYSLSWSAVSTATAASHLIQLMAGATLNLYIRRIALYQLGLATTAAFAQVNIVRLTTAGTGGGVVTPAPLDGSDGASGATAMTLPTVKGAEGTIMARTTAYFNQTAAATAGPPQPLLDIVFDLPRMKGLRIAAGATNGIAVSNINAVAGATILGLVWFAETNF